MPTRDLLGAPALACWCNLHLKQQPHTRAPTDELLFFAWTSLRWRTQACAHATGIRPTWRDDRALSSRLCAVTRRCGSRMMSREVWPCRAPLSDTCIPGSIAGWSMGPTPTTPPASWSTRPKSCARAPAPGPRASSIIPNARADVSLAVRPAPYARRDRGLARAPAETPTTTRAARRSPRPSRRARQPLASLGRPHCHRLPLYSWRCSRTYLMVLQQPPAPALSPARLASRPPPTTTTPAPQSRRPVPTNSHQHRPPTHTRCHGNRDRSVGLRWHQLKW